MTPTARRLTSVAALAGGALMLQGCLVGAVVGTTRAVVGGAARATGAVVGTTGAVVGGAARATGAVVGAGVDAVTTSDEETRARREREQREWEREQRRCEQRQRQGRDC